MKKIRLGLIAVALLSACAAFAGKAKDTFSYENGSGVAITETQFDMCPDLSGSVCGLKIDNQTQQVVQTKRNHN